MKTEVFKISLIILAALFLFSGASPWEGTASIAPEGELPASGFFIATNSYPRNTLVDITNLDTNKTTRVIVADGLNSQGLLAIVSREAAQLIGMKSGAISRIKLVQPTEPVAYYRFTEGLLSGNPVYDSGNAVRDELYSEDTYVPPDSEKTEPVINAVTGPRYILEPEWQNREIVDFFPDTKRASVKVEEEPEYVAEEEPAAEEEPESIAEEEPAAEEEPEYIAEEEPAAEEEPEYIAEEEPVIEEEAEKEPEYIAETPPEIKYNLVPAPERPPEGSIYGIDPSAIIPGIPSVSAAAARETPPVPVVPETVFSVPQLSVLDRGRYYVQLASYRTAESTENAIRQTIRQIENYGPVVFIEGDNMYKILLGPLNQGESAAVLQRFKSIGYKDAFVRYVR